MLPGASVFFLSPLFSVLQADQFVNAKAFFPEVQTAVFLTCLSVHLYCFSKPCPMAYSPDLLQGHQLSGCTHFTGTSPKTLGLASNALLV